MAKVSKYTSRDFQAIKNELLNLTQKYFPEKYSNFKEYSSEMMFLELFSYVGDTLNFNIEDAFRNSFIQHVETLEDAIRICKSYGYNIRLSGIVYDVIRVSQLVPLTDEGEPDLDYAVTIKKGSSVKDNNHTYEIQEDVIMSDYDEIVEDTFDDITEELTHYRIFSNAVVKGGQKITKRINVSEAKKDLKVLLDENVAEVISVVDLEGNTWYEVDYMAQDTVMESIPISNTKFRDLGNETYYTIKNKRVTKKFIGVCDHDNNFYLQFGQGTNTEENSEFVDYYDIIQKNNLNNLSLNENFIVNDLFYSKAYGEIPDDTTLIVKYIKAIGEDENALATTVNKIANLNFSAEIEDEFISDSIQVFNENNFTGGKLTKDLEEIKKSLPVYISSQQRCVTQNDYKMAVKNMPAKYGNIAKVYTEESEDDMGVNIYVISQNKRGNFDKTNIATKENIKKYLERFKSIGHVVHIRDVYIVNIECEVFYFGNDGYNNEEIELNIGKIISRFFDNSNMEINDPIIIDDIKKELLNYDGVRYISKVNIKNKYDLEKDYSGIVYETDDKSPNYDNDENIIMPPEEPAIFELKFPNNDIKIKHV